MIRYIDSLSIEEIENKKILLRVDFNVPVTENADGGHAIEAFRIQAIKPTVDYLLKHGALVALVSHISDLDSFEPIARQIAGILEQDMLFGGSVIGAQAAQMLEEHDLVLLENIRHYAGEEKDSHAFAKELADGFDLYINDAFAVSHRGHASVSAVAEYLPAYGGLLMFRELDELSKAIELEADGKVLVLGGAKISTKLPVVRHFLGRAEHILIGGALANTFLRARGIDVGKSLVDDGPIINEVLHHPSIMLPEDIVVSSDASGAADKVTLSEIRNIRPEDMILDIGPKTALMFGDIIRAAKVVIWNGPMGLAEVQAFSDGTKLIALAASEVRHSVVGGGDTIGILSPLHMLEKMSYVSTGGGAMLEFLAGKKLPGLQALGYYD